MAKNAPAVPGSRQEEIEYHLAKIQEIYPESKTTLYIRHPHLKDGDIVFSNDDHKEMAQELSRFVDEKILNPR